MRKLKCALLGLFAAVPIMAQADEDVWRLMIEPTFMRYEASWPIPGSKSAVFVPARVEGNDVFPLKRDEVIAQNVTLKKIFASAPAAAAETLAKLKPRYVRDANKVIQYAVLESDSPLTASTVLAPGFAGLFTETLGPDLFIAIPNRFRVFVFPRLSFTYQDFSDLIFVEYQSTPYPVSREIFELRKGKLIAIGSYR